MLGSESQTHFGEGNHGWYLHKCPDDSHESVLSASERASYSELADLGVKQTPA